MKKEGKDSLQNSQEVSENIIFFLKRNIFLLAEVKICQVCSKKMIDELLLLGSYHGVEERLYDLGNERFQIQVSLNHSPVLQL